LALAAGMIGLLGGLAAVTPATAEPAVLPVVRGPLVAMAASAAPALPTGTRSLGTLPADTRLSLNVTLKVRNQAALTALLNGLADPGSPYFHHFLAPGQFGPLFGPTLAQVAAVRAALADAGLSPGPVTADRLTIPVTATAAQAERAFGIGFDSYRLPGGQLAYANISAPKLPASVVPLITGVLGLDDMSQAIDGAKVDPATRPTVQAPDGPAVPREPDLPATAGPQPCAAASAAAADSFTTNQIALHYGLSSLYQLGDYGHGVRIALLQEQGYLPSDLAGYESCYGVHPTVRVIPVAGPVLTGAGDGATDNVELLASLAPQATLDVYEASTVPDPQFEMISHAVDTDSDQVVVDVYYQCELTDNLSLLESEETLAEEANVQDQTMIFDAGESGSTACVGLSTADAAKLNVAALAGVPYDIGVGGTTLSGDAPLAAETVWNEIADGDAGGGGLSTVWCMPAYQHKTAIPGLISKFSKKLASCANGNGGYAREVPDIVADADPFSGYVMFYKGNWQGEWGGTDSAEAVIAAVAALIDASPFCADYRSGDAGLLPQALYEFVAKNPFYVYTQSLHQVPEAIFDVVGGNNDDTASGYTGGLYPATIGYDMASGLGAPLVSGLALHVSGPVRQATPSDYYPGLAAGMCETLGTYTGVPRVTRVTPDAGPAGKPTTVTVHGAHFVPVPGADRAKVFLSLSKSYILSANCTSSTVCTVTLPALSARVVNVQISAEDSNYSGFVTADRFRYTGPPHLTTLSPARGAKGKRITIDGKNFTGVRAVCFGKAKGTSIKVISATQLTVVVPAGSGAVSVTVVGAGGTSNALKFTY
jgi:hypothetical protein